MCLIDHGTEIDSPLRNGVCTGNRRTFVACSKLYPSARSRASLNATPRNEMPIGKSSVLKPAGTIRSGKPERFARFDGDVPAPPGGAAGAEFGCGRRGSVG